MLLKKLRGLFLYNEDDETKGGSQLPDDDGVDDVLDEIVGDDGHQDDEDKKPAKRAKNPDVSKIVSKRINEEREKLAKELGYKSYEELKANRLKDKIESETDLTYDDEQVQKVVKIAQENDPERAKLEEELQTLREEKATLWEKEQLLKLKTEYPELAKLKSLSELDEKTVGFIEKGIEPVDAYFAANRAKIIAARAKGGKEHMTGPDGSNTGDKKTVTITPAQLAIYRELNPGLSDEDIIERVAKLK